MVLTEKEMCVCQLMAVLGTSQPMVSRSLGILQRAGLLQDRKDKKLRFYKLREDMSDEVRQFVQLLRDSLWDDEVFKRDREIMVECSEFQKITGRCDMKAFKEFMEKVRGGKR